MPEESRHGVRLTSLDDELFDGAGATKRDLVEYLDAVADRLLAELAGRALSVIRARPGQPPFMQKNVPNHTPEWVPTATFWAESSKRQVRYAVAEDRRTLVWFANQRAVEYHPSLGRVDGTEGADRLVLDLDPPEGAGFSAAVAAAELVRRALADVGLAGAVKTSGAKGVHVFVPVAASHDDAAAATRALAARAAALDPELATTEFVKEERHGRVFVDATRVGGSATVVAAYSPRVRPGTPVSFPVSWSELSSVDPRELTICTALERLGDAEPWLGEPQRLPDDLVAEGRDIPIARVQAMHEGARRARGRKATS